MLDVLATGSLHLPAISHVRSGFTRHRSALCMIVGASLGPLVVVRRYAGPTCHRWSLYVVHWPVLIVAGGPTCRRSALCVVVGPSFLSLGYHLTRTRRHWWAHSLSLGCGQGLLIVVGTSPGPTRFHWVSSSLGCPTLRRWALVPMCWRKFAWP